MTITAQYKLSAQIHTAGHVCMPFSHTGLEPSANAVRSLALRLASKRVKEPSRVRGCALAGDAAARDLGVGATSVWCQSHNLWFLFFSHLFLFNPQVVSPPPFRQGYMAYQPCDLETPECRSSRQIHNLNKSIGDCQRGRILY